MARRKKKSGGGFFLGAAVGAVLGGIAGMLSAPKSGRQMRADITREGSRVAREGKKAVAKTKQQIRKAAGGRTKKKTATKSRK